MNLFRLKQWWAARRDRRLRARIWREAMVLARLRGGDVLYAVEQVAAARRHLQALDLNQILTPCERIEE